MDLILPQRPPRARNRLKRWLLKSIGFAAFTLLVLNPNLKRAYLQVRHTLNPESLIQTQVPGLTGINQQIDRLVENNAGRQSEARLVARYVVRNVHYLSDYDNWGNVEYWPTPQEAWQKGQEDCDGRAILTASILRSRGFSSARLVIGLDHMWVRVNENENAPAKEPSYIALLGPNPTFSLEINERPQSGDLVRVARALVYPTALRTTSTHLFADIPNLRKAILVVGLVLLCFHPCKRSTTLLALTATGLAGVALLGNWRPGQEPSLQVTLGMTLLLTAVAGAVVLKRVFLWRAWRAKAG
jgi:hypothetical protein